MHEILGKVAFLCVVTLIGPQVKLAFLSCKMSYKGIEFFLNGIF